MAGEPRFSWEYDVERQKLLSLYQKGKDKQWHAQSRIDWDLELDYENRSASRSRSSRCGASPGSRSGCPSPAS